MKHKVLVLFMAVVMPLALNAQDVANVFLAMPDSMVEYLDGSMRQSLANRNGGGEKPVVVNALGDSTCVDTITADYLLLKCNKARTLEIKMLPYGSVGDTIVCVVNTFHGPAAESSMSFYDTQWRKMNINSVDPVQMQSLMSKPDSISDDEFEQLRDMVDPKLVEMQLSPTDNSLTCRMSLPNVPIDKKKQIEQLLMLKKLKWDGIAFN